MPRPLGCRSFLGTAIRGGETLRGRSRDDSSMPPPRFAPLVVVGDDALLLAEITTLVAKRSAYLPLLNGPRLQRPDREHEVICRSNAIAKVQPQSVIFAGLPEATSDMFSPFPRRTVVRRIQHADEVIAAGIANRRIAGEPLYWSRTHIGVGVLQALRSHRPISFGCGSLE
jgi:hypothetical protein